MSDGSNEITQMQEDIAGLFKELVKLNSNAYLSHKKTGYQFDENEVPKDKLKQIGIEWDDLSAVQKNDLLKGRETSAVTVIRIENGKKKYTREHLQLSRLGANSAEIMFRQQNQAGLRKKNQFKV